MLNEDKDLDDKFEAKSEEPEFETVILDLNNPQPEGHIQWIEECNSCDKSIACYNRNHGSEMEDICPIDRCENCNKPIHHLDCMAIIDHTPSNSDIWCDKCYDEYYIAEHIHIRVGRTITNSENGGYQDFKADMTIGEILFQLNTEFNTRAQLDQDKIWLDGNISEILDDLRENDEYNEFNFGDIDLPNLADYIVSKLLDTKYPRRKEAFSYAYSHWFSKVTLQVWRIKWKGAKLENSISKGIFIHTLEPDTILSDIARDIHEGRIKPK